MPRDLNPDQLGRLRAIAKDAAGECSRMFSKWVKSDVSITMEELQLVPFSDVMGTATDSEISVCLYMSFAGGLKGSLLFSFAESSAQQLLDLLLRRKPGEATGLGEMEASALNETANILGCAYLNSLSKSLELKVIPGPPLLIQDLTAAVLGSVLAEQASVQDEALLVRVVFRQAEREMNCSFYFMPLLQELGQELGKKKP